MSHVSLVDVTKVFGNTFKGVDDVSLEIAEGSFVTLLGPSGSGKTTTLRMIAGLETPSEGVIRIGEDVVYGNGRNVATHRRNIGMVFQSYAVWPHMTVGQNIGFPLTMKAGMSSAQSRKAVGEMVDYVNLTGMVDRYPSELSGGQQQRVALARALVAQPRVLLFDEPLSNLDAKLRESMRQLIKELHADLKVTAVYVTHDQLEAMWLSDEIHVMSNGKVVQSGSPQEIYDSPQSLFVADFTGHSNVLSVQAADAGSQTVKNDFGPALKVTKWPAGGQPTHVLIRYNQVQLSPATDAALDNTARAKVDFIQFVGDRYHIEVVTEGGARLIVYRDQLGPIREVGQAVNATLAPEDLRPLVEKQRQEA